MAIITGRGGGGGDYKGSNEGVWHCRPYRRWPLGEEGGGVITGDLVKGCGTVVPIGGGHWERRGGGGVNTNEGV